MSINCYLYYLLDGMKFLSSRFKVLPPWMIHEIHLLLLVFSSLVLTPEQTFFLLLIYSIFRDTQSRFCLIRPKFLTVFRSY
jgi:hypothetical protein